MLRVFDKDGTLVQTKSGETFPKLGDQQLIPGVKERIAAYAAAGDIIVVASNQGGIPRYKTLEDAIAEFQELMTLLPEISVCFFCPDFDGKQCWSVPNPETDLFWRSLATDKTYPAGKSKDYYAAKPLHEGVGAGLSYGELIGTFRKPNPGMLKAAMLWANADACTYVGDHPEDEGAAISAGVPYQYVGEWLADQSMSTKIKVFYLKNGDFYTNGQSLCSDADAMMPEAKIRFYLEGAKERGLTFTVVERILEVLPSEVDDYLQSGYQLA